MSTRFLSQSHLRSSPSSPQDHEDHVVSKTVRPARHEGIASDGFLQEINFVGTGRSGCRTIRRRLIKRVIPRESAASRFPQERRERGVSRPDVLPPPSCIRFSGSRASTYRGSESTTRTWKLRPRGSGLNITVARAIYKD